MATIALPRPIPPHRPSSTITPPLSLESINSSSPAQCSIPVPNKHIPVCPTGPARADEPNTPPPSPPSPRSLDRSQQSSALYPTDGFKRLDNGSLSIFEIDANQVSEAVDFTSRQPLPDPSLVFPWLHGLHPQNHVQQAFFAARKRTLRKTPSCIRAITIVKADGVLTCARLKGAVAPEDVMQSGEGPDFVEADPREGFSVRNFQIQTAKVARTSDIIVYGQDSTETRKLAWDIATGQQRWREMQIVQGVCAPEYNTFVCTSPFSDFEENHPEIVAVDSSGCLTGNVLDFFHQERREMWNMTEASEISHNVFMGPTPEPGTPEEQQFDILIECNDLGRLNPLTLQVIAESPDETGKQQMLDFPSSGSILPPTWSHSEADGILETCKWIYHLAHGSYPQPDFEPRDDVEGDSPMPSEPQITFNVRPRKILLHCADGYTESTMLGIAYFSYSTGRAVPEAWLHLHTTKKRNFFAYPTDVALLTAITPRLLRESPVCVGMSLTEITTLTKDEPSWFAGLDGSFPSRVLDYMYLGNLGHANNPDLLKALGIRQILSVGETAMWREGDMEEWGAENVCVVQGVQDNGIDPLTDEFSRCLEFIDRGRRNGTATLVHCRVGVSRSATICIAEVMRAMNMSFPRAYCFVRARRLNVIIQPHLRFAYELLRWEETLQRKGNEDMSVKRDLEWGEITRAIALMNSPYSR
ncbi:hypothetical protein BGZ61DRAFT_342495 [Ilyonectria robusta]|uniref:uncharacterized protein n=1 Tax=Ilyonectria robusta TaxID=1079257 RepID=UPI001E8ECC9D|nr:uncharacterized protein BGZ61DRAFT_342495 [Ilyonectria robusta]KAH8735342.1 hypothetical protein BGZ61DRAFT_342495 [Ilyonectria robusta]